MKKWLETLACLVIVLCAASQAHANPSPPTVGRVDENCFTWTYVAHGHADPGTPTGGSLIYLVLDGDPLGCVAPGGDTSWAYTFTLPACTDDADSGHTLDVWEVDSLGNASSVTEYSFAQRVMDLDAPFVTGTAENPGWEYVTSGTASPPGATVCVIIDGNLVGGCFVAADGSWSITYNLPPCTSATNSTRYGEAWVVDGNHFSPLSSFSFTQSVVTGTTLPTH